MRMSKVRSIVFATILTAGSLLITVATALAEGGPGPYPR